jgi:hypothetical protein
MATFTKVRIVARYVLFWVLMLVNLLGLRWAIFVFSVALTCDFFSVHRLHEILSQFKSLYTGILIGSMRTF